MIPVRHRAANAPCLFVAFLALAGIGFGASCEGRGQPKSQTGSRPADKVYAARGQIVLRYTEAVNGSLGNVAGVVNDAGNVMGLMPHPEHAVDTLLGSADGGLLLAALVDAAAEHALVAGLDVVEDFT